MPTTLGAFAFNRRLTVDTTSAGANVASSLTSFPIAVMVTPTSWGSVGAGHFFDASNTAGKRVQFFDSAGTNLDYEVESYDSAGQTAVYWVRVPTVTGNSSTTVAVGYGSDPNGADQSNGTAVWDSSYKAVYHLGGTAGTGDSTTNANTLTYSVTGATNYTGLVGTSVLFDGSTGRAQATDSASLGMGNATQFTVSAFVNPVAMPTSGSAIKTVVTRYDYDGTASAGYDLSLTYVSAGTYRWQLAYKSTGGTDDNIYSASTSFSTGTDYAVAAVKNGTSGLMYVNGAQSGVAATLSATGVNYVASIAKKLNIANFGYWTVGSTELGRYFNARIGEVRISQTNRSADWLKAEYFSMKQTSWAGDGWLTVSAENFRPRFYVIRQSITRAAVF